MEKLNKIGKFYTRIVMKHIGIFIFVGILFVVFHDQGWFPDENIYAISQLVYEIILPALIAFEGGRKTGDNGGGIQAVLAVSGLLAAESSVGILGAMILGPMAGFLWKKEEKIIEKYARSEFQMLVKNLVMGITGCILAVFSCYLVTPVLAAATGMIGRIMNFLIEYRAIGLLSVVIEPLKVFFMNNVVNHAILVPLGMEQLQGTGSSILFLLETNPGPGLGVMAALFCMRKERRNEYMSAMFAEAAGGIHEVYFPFIWSDLRLLLPLILGGMSGNLCFSFLHAGLRGVVSPGSILTILLMAGKGMTFPVLAGIVVSAVVSFIGSFLILRLKKPKEIGQGNMEKKEEKEMMAKEEKRLGHVGFVCDGGVGSSAMGAAIFRRVLAARGIEDVCVKAYASDLIPADIDMIVCQKDYFEMLPKEAQTAEVYKVESLIRAEEYEELAEQIQRRNEGKR